MCAVKKQIQYFAGGHARDIVCGVLVPVGQSVYSGTRRKRGVCKLNSCILRATVDHFCLRINKMSSLEDVGRIFVCCISGSFKSSIVYGVVSR